MSLDFDEWKYDGQQWDNVAKIIPMMFQTCEKNIQSICKWIKEYKLDDKFKKVQKSNEDNHIKIIEIENYFNRKTDQMEQQNMKQIELLNQKISVQENIILRLEKKLSMKDIIINKDIENKQEYIQLDSVFQQCYQNSSSDDHDGNESDNINKSSIESLNNNIINNNNNPKNNTQKKIDPKNVNNINNNKQTNSQQIINDSKPQNKNNNINLPQPQQQQQQQKQQPSTDQQTEEEQDKIYQYENQKIIWKMINLAINKCYINQNIKEMNERIQNTELQILNEIDKTKGKIDSSNNLISQVDSSIKDIQKMNENKFDKIFSLNLDKFSNKLERGLQDIEILQQSKILIETLDSKYDEKCNILHSEIKITHKRIDDIKPPIQNSINELNNKLELFNRDHLTSITQIIQKLSDSSKTINDKININHDQLNQKIDNNYKENKTLIETQNNTIKSNTQQLNKNVTQFRTDIIADLEKLENGLSDIFPRIKEFQSMVVEIQKQLLDIAEMEHIQFNHNLQQKMAVFITNIWKKADKTENAVDKLIDTLLQHSSQLNSIPDSNNNNHILSAQHSQQYQFPYQANTPKPINDNINNFSTPLDHHFSISKKDNYFKLSSMDEADEFYSNNTITNNNNLTHNNINNDDDSESQQTNNQYPIVQLKSLNQSNFRVKTTESQQQDSPLLKQQKPFIKEQMKLKKISYSNAQNACKEHTISFTKALNLDTSTHANNRNSHSSQKAKRPLTVQGSAATTTTAKGSQLLLASQNQQILNDKNLKNISYDNNNGLQFANSINKKLENNIIGQKGLINKFYDSKESSGFQGNSQNLLDNSEQFQSQQPQNQSLRLNISQNRKRTVSQSNNNNNINNKTKGLNHSIVVFNNSTNPLADSHTFEQSNNNLLINFASPVLEGINSEQGNLLPYVSNSNGVGGQQSQQLYLNQKKKEYDQSLQKNLLDIKLKILKKIKIPNNENQQHFTDQHLNHNSQQ